MPSSPVHRKLFAVAKELWPDLPSKDRTDEVRALAAEINDGVFSVSVLNEYQKRSLLNKLVVKLEAKQDELTLEWKDLLKTINYQDATEAQYYRMAVIATEKMFTPARVLGIISNRIRKSPTLWEFPLDRREMSQLLKILESYRKKRPTYYYDAR